MKKVGLVLALFLMIVTISVFMLANCNNGSTIAAELSVDGASLDSPPIGIDMSTLTPPDYSAQSLEAEEIPMSFTDVFPPHWAFEYIEKMASQKVINGYPDGSFLPENKVKTGEFFKMACMTLFKKYTYPGVSEGEHWASPYAKTLTMLDSRYPKYDSNKLESYITREEAVEVLAEMFIRIQIRNGNRIEFDENQPYIKTFSDESEIIGYKPRRSVDLCTQYNLINGFEDGTFRSKESLTRAQAAKLLFVVQGEGGF